MESSHPLLTVTVGTDCISASAKGYGVLVTWDFTRLFTLGVSGLSLSVGPFTLSVTRP